MSKKAKKNIWFNSWWDKINPTWQAIISIGIVFCAGFGTGSFIDTRHHSMEIIKINQEHNIETKRQLIEFDEKLSNIKKELDDCQQQYRKLENEN